MTRRRLFVIQARQRRPVQWVRHTLAISDPLTGQTATNTSRVPKRDARRWITGQTVVYAEPRVAAVRDALVRALRPTARERRRIVFRPVTPPDCLGRFRLEAAVVGDNGLVRWAISPAVTKAPGQRIVVPPARRLSNLRLKLATSWLFTTSREMGLVDGGVR
jgi:hypothetical protein